MKLNKIKKGVLQIVTFVFFTILHSSVILKFIYYWCKFIFPNTNLFVHPDGNSENSTWIRSWI